MILHMPMVKRKYWLKKIQEAWDRHSVIWLSGVRRTGKTCLCQTISGVEYFDCELPRTRRMMEDPESFLDGIKGEKVVLDEIHRLENPSQLLKIAADYYKDIYIIATGSSTLGASAKFKDTLAGRKSELWLTPINSDDVGDFGNDSIEHRFLYGGLPPFFMEKKLPERDFQEWIDAYWAKDIQELFRLERRHSFQKFAELLFAQSGGIFEATRFARPCEVSRTTISNYLKILEATFVVHLVRPFTSRKSTEIVSAPKVYSFDTGFMCYYKGWDILRNDDYGLLWEHLVLNEIHSKLQSRNILYWRDKQGHEIDFVYLVKRNKPVAVECKWSDKDFDSKNLQVFLRSYPDAESYVVAHDVKKTFQRKYGQYTVTFTGLSGLIKKLLLFDQRLSG